MLRFLIYGMGVLEFALYSSHEIIHHSLNVRQNGWGVLSYLLALLTFILATVETYLIINFAKNVFYAQDINEFDGIGDKQLGIDDIMQYYIQQVKRYFFYGFLEHWNRLKQTEKVSETAY